MQANYTAFVERMIFRYEGGYGWNKSDPGGPTKYGITCYDLARYLHEPMTDKAAWAPRVKAMPLMMADAIYQTKYATACRFDDLEDGVDCAVFDFGVNSGPSRAVRFCQQIVGVPADGILGPVTLEAINGHSAASFINALCDRRLAFMRSLSIWGTFGRGWASRVADLRAYALALATKATPTSEAVPRDKTPTIKLAFAKADTEVA